MATAKRKKTGRAKSESGQPTALPADQHGLISSLQRLSPARTILLICLVSFLAYANSLGGDFVFDDTDQIVENQNIRSWDNLAKAFTTHVWAFRERPGTLNVPPPLPYYRPLFTVMLTVEYHMFGLWPQGWHLVGLLLHVLCAAGVFYVILRISGRNLVALFASILFAVHPVHAESVSWISGMTDPLFGVFFLASFCLYLKARAPGEGGRAARRAFVLSVAMFVLAAFAKESALSLVVLVFGYELIEPSRQKNERLITATKRALPYAAVALIYLVPRYLVLGELMWRNPQAPDRPLAYTLLTLPFVLWSYVAHLLWPINLSVTYNTHFVTIVASPRFLLPVGVLGLVVAAFFLYRKRVSREVWQGLLLVFVPLLPVLNLGQVSREEYLVFDHYLYLSVAGFAYLVAFGIFKVGAFGSSVNEKRNAGLRRSVLATAAFALIVLAFTVVANRENRPWADSHSLWSNVARVRPTYWAAHYNAGLALLDAKRFDEAHASLEQAIALKPDEPNVLAALGRCYDGKGETSSAVASFKRAIDINPEMFESYNDLGAVYFKNRDYVLAEANFVAALRLEPGASASRFNLGLCYARQGRYSDATGELERVVQAKPDDALALYELGLAYERTGRTSDAVRVFQTAGKLAKSQELADRLAEGLGRLRGDSRQP
ncbi:MAG TPA: tetratricopeptide repeat protein [Blastocatellia bacterium]|nr:tetratricopeptide repeat protein [Blastocatellia bacterium]